MLDLIVFGDSLSLPHPSTRPGDDEFITSVDDVWPQLLVASGYVKSYWFRSVGGANSAETLKSVQATGNYLEEASAKLTIIQVGIGDAAPRPYPLWAWPVLRKVDEVIRRIKGKKVLERNSILLRIWGRPWIPPMLFGQNVEKAVEAALKFSDSVLLVALVPPGNNLTGILGYFTVESYNGELKRIARLNEDVGFVDFTGDLHPDGHHLTCKGHADLFRALVGSGKLHRAH